MYRGSFELEKPEWKFGGSRNECQGNTFSSSPKLSRVFLWLDRNTENMFLYLLENTARKKKETTCLLWSSKCKFSFLARLRQQLVLVLCFHRVIETRFSTNQRAFCLNTKHLIYPCNINTLACQADKWWNNN